VNNWKFQFPLVCIASLFTQNSVDCITCKKLFSSIFFFFKKLNWWNVSILYLLIRSLCIVYIFLLSRHLQTVYNYSLTLFLFSAKYNTMCRWIKMQKKLITIWFTDFFFSFCLLCYIDGNYTTYITFLVHVIFLNRFNFFSSLFICL